MREETKLVSGDGVVPVSGAVIASASIGRKFATLEKSPEKQQEENDSALSISVTDVYEGPRDLLLDLVRKQNIDIYDIPIARITAQYLVYVEKIRELDVNVAADFMYMAAALIQIKSKMW